VDGRNEKIIDVASMSSKEGRLPHAHDSGPRLGVSAVYQPETHQTSSLENPYPPLQAHTWIEAREGAHPRQRMGSTRKKWRK